MPNNIRLISEKLFSILLVLHLSNKNRAGGNERLFFCPPVISKLDLLFLQSAGVDET